MKKAACLRMADGGDLITRWANRLVGNNPKAMADRGRSEERDAPPASPPPAQLPNVMFATGGEIPKAPAPQPKPQTPIPDWMRYALRDGGTVPGKGEGDKIPALYEPGEFVVSNDMLERTPGLREHLHSLRDETLEAQGKDPEAVDAKQAKGKTLRAEFGVAPYVDHRMYNGPPAMPEQPKLGYTPKTPGTTVMDPMRPNWTTGSAPPTQPPAATDVRAKWNPANASPEAKEWMSPRTGPQQGTLKGALPTATRAAGGLRMLANPLVTLAAAGGTMVGDDIYSNLSDKAKDTIGGTINAGLRMFGGGVNDDAMNTVNAQANGPTPAPTPAAAPTFATPDPTKRLLRQGTTPPQFSRESPQDLEIGPEDGVVKRVGNSFSGANVSNYGRQNVVPGMDPALIQETLTNPDGSKWSAADNARMAMNLRDGNDPYAGTSRQEKLSPIQQALRDNPVGKVGRQSALKAAAEMENTQTLRRGQDVQMTGHQMTAATARMQARVDQMNKDRQFGFDREKFGEEVAKNNFEVRQKSRKDTTDHIASLIAPGADGKPDTAMAAQYTAALQAQLGSRIAELQKHLELNPGDRGAQGELTGLQQRELAQMDPKELQKFVTGMELKRKMQETATGKFNPIGTRPSDFAGTPTSLRYKPAMIGGDYEIIQGSKNVGEIPARHVDGGWFGQKSSRFDSLKEKQ